MLAPIHPTEDPGSAPDLEQIFVVLKQLNGKRSRYSPHICVVMVVTQPYTLDYKRLIGIFIFGHAKHQRGNFPDQCKKPATNLNINLSCNFISDVTD